MPYAFPEERALNSRFGSEICFYLQQLLLLLQHRKVQAFPFFLLSNLIAWMQELSVFGVIISEITQDTYFGDYHQEPPSTLYTYSSLTDISESGQVGHCTRTHHATPLWWSAILVWSRREDKRKIQGRYKEILIFLSIPACNFSSPNSTLNLAKEADWKLCCKSQFKKITGGKKYTLSLI